MNIEPSTDLDIETELRLAIQTGDHERIDALGAELDLLAVDKPKASILQAALWYAQQGLKVFPLRADSKIPHPGTHGCLDATTDEAQIRAWWAEWPDSNVAIATGHLVDVIDIDGPIGVASWSELIATDQLPDILGHVRTRRAGGHHLYIKAQGGGNKTNILPGIDTRGVGGYVCAPPTVIDGVTYTWARPLVLDGVGA